MGDAYWLVEEAEGINGSQASASVVRWALRFPLRVAGLYGAGVGARSARRQAVPLYYDVTVFRRAACGGKMDRGVTPDRKRPCKEGACFAQTPSFFACPHTRQRNGHSESCGVPDGFSERFAVEKKLRGGGIAQPGPT